DCRPGGSEVGGGRVMTRGFLHQKIGMALCCQRCSNFWLLQAGQGVLVCWLMNRVYRLTALVFLVLWVPTTTHCYLEKIPGLEFLQCASDTGNSSCEGDGCQTV